MEEQDEGREDIIMQILFNFMNKLVKSYLVCIRKRKVRTQKIKVYIKE